MKVIRRLSSHRILAARKKQTALGGLLVFASCLGFAQSPLEFEAADVRPNKSNVFQWDVLPSGQFTVRNIPVKELVRFAYNIRESSAVTGGPPWINSEPYDVVAKAPPNTSIANLRLMLQNLLAQEFKLVTHQEQKPQSAFALVVDRNGPKLQKAADSGKAECNRVIDPDTPLAELHIACKNVSMADLALNLFSLASTYIDRPVVDATGIPGTYDLRLDWAARETIDQGGLTIFDAIDKQLGLKLEERKVPLPVIVIDRVEKLSGN